MRSKLNNSPSKLNKNKNSRQQLSFIDNEDSNTADSTSAVADQAAGMRSSSRRRSLATQNSKSQLHNHQQQSRVTRSSLPDRQNPIKFETRKSLRKSLTCRKYTNGSDEELSTGPVKRKRSSGHASSRSHQDDESNKSPAASNVESHNGDEDDDGDEDFDIFSEDKSAESNLDDDADEDINNNDEDDLNDNERAGLDSFRKTTIKKLSMKGRNKSTDQIESSSKRGIRRKKRVTILRESSDSADSSRSADTASIVVVNQDAADDLDDENENDHIDDDESPTSQHNQSFNSNKYIQINNPNINHPNKILHVNTYEKMDLLFRSVSCSTDLNKTPTNIQLVKSSYIPSNNVLDRLITKQYEQTFNSHQQQLNQNKKILMQLPKVNMKELNDDFYFMNDYASTLNFVKYIERTPDELDQDCEYDMDEEDYGWIQTINEERHRLNLEPQITQEQFEILMDRFEKESYFQTCNNAGQNLNSSANASPNKINDSASAGAGSANGAGAVVNTAQNEDALCCICLDGECLNSNAILFCDMCNLAVHQECYGVPYIPEGQWLCRRCIQSPSAPVDCILCPNRYGAFKETDRGLWSHVVCAIWIPEVHFANTVFLEPIIGIENIDKARWKLMCYICRKRNVGACIQCDKQNCYTAFHVTCAQQAGLYMNIHEEIVEPDHSESNGNGCSSSSTSSNKKKKKGSMQHNNNQKRKSITNHNISALAEVKKCAYCDIHTPLETLSPHTRKQVCGIGNNNIKAINSHECDEALKTAQKMRMKRARKILAERLNAPPQICLPVIPKEKCQEIMSNKIDDSFQDKEEFFNKLMQHWLMKRYSRNGVPLLKRLQNNGTIKKTVALNATTTTTKIEEAAVSSDKENENESVRQQLKDQLAYLKKLRQGLEKARLLLEMIRKRERKKSELIKSDELVTLHQINPFNGVLLKHLIHSLIEMDKNKIFLWPVNASEAPNYYQEIKHPMDFTKMLIKINQLEYDRFDQFEYDFDLIIDNCMTYNEKKSVFYKAAQKLREQARPLLNQAKRTLINNSADETCNQVMVKAAEGLTNPFKESIDLESSNKKKTVNRRKSLATNNLTPNTLTRSRRNLSVMPIKATTTTTTTITESTTNEPPPVSPSLSTASCKSNHSTPSSTSNKSSVSGTSASGACSITSLSK